MSDYDTDEEDEIENLELQLIAGHSKLLAKQIMLNESIKIGTEIDSSIDEHIREMEQDIWQMEQNVQQAQINAVEMLQHAARIREMNVCTAIQLEEQMNSYESRLSNIRTREREAVAAKKEVNDSAMEHIQELRTQLSECEQDCAKLQVKVGKHELQSGPFLKLQQQYQAKKEKAEADMASASEKDVTDHKPLPLPQAPSSSAAAPPSVEPPASPGTITHSPPTASAPAASNRNPSIPIASSFRKQGYLLKLSPVWLVGWQRRYFYLEKANLTYFKTAEDRSNNLLPLGNIPICEFLGMGALLGELIAKDGPSVRIRTKSRTFELGCESESEAEEWAAAIKEAVR